MALTAGQERFAQALVKDLPGLNIDVARAWTKLEVGDYNNLGIMDSPNHPHQYATPELGAQAAADLIKRSNNYTGIIKSLSGTPNQQAWAIITSPWHLGGNGLAAAGGVDTYYMKGFVSSGFSFTQQLAKSTGSQGTLAQAPSTAQLVSYVPTSTAATDRISVLQAAIATQTRNVQVNLAAGKTAAAATDQATLNKYKVELATLLSAPKATTGGGVSATAPNYTGPTLADALGSNPNLTTPTQVYALAKQLKALGIGGSSLTEGDIGAYLIDFIGKPASMVPFNFSGVTGADPTQNADKTGANDPVPGENVAASIGGLSDAIGSIGETAVSVFTYLLAIIVVGLGIFLYSKGQRQEAPVA